ncbi:MAG: adenosylcobinamide-GDP ribazoletransferase [Eubacteriales bacterium]|nr:adenosylcobinamide-GDP ribazoletransferase [Eubacteriales bacterium]
MLKSIIVAFSMYSKIPMPHVEWNEKSMRYYMCFFPMVGMVTGLCAVGCFYLLEVAGMSRSATAAILTVLPVLINGGIHMDGFMDTMDARSSYKPMEEKLKILKDPHMGAFAVISAIVYVLLSFAFFCEVTEAEIVWIGAGYVYSRILSGLSVVTFKKAKKDGMVAASADAAQKNVKWILTAELALFAAVALWCSPVMGAVCLFAGGLVFAYYRHMSYRIFGGITGDLAGYFLQMCELVILIGVVLAGKMGGIL